MASSIIGSNHSTIKISAWNNLQPPHTDIWMPKFPIDALKTPVSFTKKANLWFVGPHCSSSVSYCLHLVFLAHYKSAILYVALSNCLLLTTLLQMFITCSSFRNDPRKQFWMTFIHSAIPVRFVTVFYRQGVTLGSCSSGLGSFSNPCFDVIFHGPRVHYSLQTL